MKRKVVKLNECSREDLELIARWNQVLFSTGDTDEKLISRLYKSAYRKGTILNVNCVASEGLLKQALATLNHRRVRDEKAASNFDFEPTPAA